MEKTSSVLCGVCRKAVSCAAALSAALVLSACLVLAACPSAAYADSPSSLEKLNFVKTYMTKFGFYTTEDDMLTAQPDFYLAEFYSDMVNKGISEVDVQTLRDWMDGDGASYIASNTVFFGLIPKNIGYILNQYCLAGFVGTTVGDEKSWPYYHRGTVFSANAPFFQLTTPYGVEIDLENNTNCAKFNPNSMNSGGVYVNLYFSTGDYSRIRIWIVDAFTSMDYYQSVKFPFAAVVGSGNFGSTNSLSFMTSGYLSWPNGYQFFVGDDDRTCSKVGSIELYDRNGNYYDEWNWGMSGIAPSKALAYVGFSKNVGGYQTVDSFLSNFVWRNGADSFDLEMNLSGLGDYYKVGNYTVVECGISAAAGASVTSMEQTIPLYGWNESNRVLCYLPDVKDLGYDSGGFISHFSFDSAYGLTRGLMSTINDAAGDLRDAASQYQVVGSGYEYWDSDEKTTISYAGTSQVPANGGSNASGTGVSDEVKRSSSVVNTSTGKVDVGRGAGKTVKTAASTGDLGGGDGKKVEPGSGTGSGSGSGGGSGDGDGDGDQGGSGGGDQGGSGSGGGDETEGGSGDGGDGGQGGSGSGDGDGGQGGSGDGGDGFSQAGWLSGKFPFCLPYDYSRLVSLYSAEPEAPRFTWKFWAPDGSVDYVVDLSQFDSVAAVCRTGMLVSLMCGLVFVAVRFINMLRSAAR